MIENRTPQLECTVYYNRPQTLTALRDNIRRQCAEITLARWRELRWNSVTEFSCVVCRMKVNLNTFCFRSSGKKLINIALVIYIFQVLIDQKYKGPLNYVCRYHNTLPHSKSHERTICILCNSTISSHTLWVPEFLGSQLLVVNIFRCMSYQTC